MDSVLHFFLTLWKIAKASNVAWSVLTPIFTLMAIWFISRIGLMIFGKTEKLRRIFIIHRMIIISSLIVAFVIISVICYWWSKNLFSQTHAELGLLISLIVAFTVPVISMLVLRSYCEKTKLNEMTGQPVSAEQARSNIPLVNKAFHKMKIWYLVPPLGFLFLLLLLLSGTNLISIVYDNSESMNSSNSYQALNETFDKLGENNELIITTLNGLNSTWQNGSGRPMRELMKVRTTSGLRAGRNYAYNNPNEAKNALGSILMSDETVWGSPICEAIWKMWIFTKETKANANYKHKLLILITDGLENYTGDLNYFFYEDEDFAAYYTPDNTYIVDYSDDGNGILIKKFEDEGATITRAVSSVDDYLAALDEALHSFQKIYALIICTIAICVLGTLVGLMITPKKISI